MTRRSVVWQGARALPLVLLGLALGRPLAAQRLRGTVRDTMSARPVVGVVLTLYDAAGRVTSRTISDEQGRYALPFGATAVRLRALRIGFQPRDVKLPPAGASDVTLDLAMATIPAMLTSVKVSGRPLCPGSGDQGLAFSLWEQARAGLLASVVAREARPAKVKTILYERGMMPDDDRVRTQTAQAHDGVASRPFIAVAEPAVFARNGYMKEDATGRTFYAPDADVLMDESFAVTHCFSLTIDRQHPGQVGIEFSPAGGRGRDTLVDVDGVLWLDRDQPQLRTLEFEYTGLEPVASSVRTGGTLSFRSMPNGVVLIDWWSLRLPTMKPAAEPPYTVQKIAQPSRRTERTNVRVVEVHETGGELLAATWPDGTSLQLEPGRIAGRVLEKGTTRPRAGVVVRLAGTREEATTDSAGAFVLAPVIPGRYEITAADSTLGDFVAPRSTSRDVRLARGQAARVDVELPSLSSVLGRICSGERTSQEATILVGRVADSTGTPLRDGKLTATWLADVRMTPGSMTTRSEAVDIDVDRSGRFRLCNVALERPVKLAAGTGELHLADTTIVPSDTPFQSLVWRVRPGATGARADAGALLTGTITSRSSGAAVAGAEVALPALARRTTTDSAGRFRLGGLPSGRYALVVRDLRFLAESDSVTLAGGARVDRAYRLTPQKTAALDTVRTVAARKKYISPALQGFEERRTLGIGHFIDEDVLRKNDNTKLGSVLLARIPGIQVVPYGGREYLGSGRGVGSLGAMPRAEPYDAKSPRGCWATVYLDGIVFYRSGQPDTSAPDLNLLTVNTLGGIEYYPGGATLPPQYNATKASGCGVLLLWTRER